MAEHAWRAAPSCRVAILGCRALAPGPTGGGFLGSYLAARASRWPPSSSSTKGALAARRRARPQGLPASFFGWMFTINTDGRSCLFEVRLEPRDRPLAAPEEPLSSEVCSSRSGIRRDGVCRTGRRSPGTVVVWTIGEMLYSPRCRDFVAELALPTARRRPWASTRCHGDSPSPSARRLNVRARTIRPRPALGRARVRRRARLASIAMGRMRPPGRTERAKAFHGAALAGPRSFRTSTAT